MTSIRNPLRSGLTGITDQSLIAITNLLLTFFAAQGGVESLGSFALVGALYFSILIIIRALVAEPYMAIQDSGSAHLYDTVAVSFAAFGSLVSGVVAINFFPMDAPWILMPTLVFVLSLYEFSRIRAYVQGRSGSALGGSLLVLSVVIATGLINANFGAERWLYLSWCWIIAGTIGYIFVVLRTGARPTLRRGAWIWFRKHLLPKGKNLTLDAAGIVLVAHVGLFVISSNGSLTDVASIRAVTALLSPVSLVFTGLTISLTPALARANSATRASTLRAFWSLILVASLIAALVTTLFGSELIALAFGAPAVPSYATLLIAVSSVVVFSLGTPLLAQVRVRGSYSIVAIVRICTGVVIIVALNLTGAGSFGLTFFSFQLGQALLIFVAAWIALRNPSPEAGAVAAVTS